MNREGLQKEQEDSLLIMFCWKYKECKLSLTGGDGCQTALERRYFMPGLVFHDSGVRVKYVF